MLPQKTPILKDFKNENLLSYIKKHFNLKSKKNLLLFTVYIITCLIVGIAHPILVFHGEKGAGKSTKVKQFRLLRDPVKNLIMSMPLKKDDLVATISNSFLTCFDNIQKVTSEISELFCIVSTGGAVTKRILYTDN